MEVRGASAGWGALLKLGSVDEWGGALCVGALWVCVFKNAEWLRCADTSEISPLLRSPAASTGTPDSPQSTKNNLVLCLAFVYVE